MDKQKIDDLQFPQATIKLLQDKNSEKRSSGQKQVETMVQLATKNNNVESLYQFIEVFSKQLIGSTLLVVKKSGMLAMQSLAASLMTNRQTELAEKLVSQIVQPILECLSDKDEKVRLAAVETMIQLTKSLKSILLICLNDIFDCILDHAADSDENVLKALLILDNSLKTLLTSEDEKQYFNLNEFMLLLHRKLKTTIPQVRTALISWIQKLDSHHNDLYCYLPLLLEGLFAMLQESNKEIRSAADVKVVEFLRQVESKANYNQQVNEQIIDILVKICSAKKNNYAKLSALLWIFEYLRVFQAELEEETRSQRHTTQSPISPSQQLIHHNLSIPFIHQQSVPVLIQSNSFNQIKESPLRKTILSRLSHILQPILNLLSHEEEEIRKAAQKTNELLLKIMDKIKYTSIEFMNVVPTVKEMLTEKRSSTAESALVWMRHLLQIYSDKLLPTIEDILTKLIDRLNDAEASVVQNVMDVLGSISLHDQYFDLVIDKILGIFLKHRELLEKKGELIFKKLCSLINPQKVYTAITAKLILNYVEQDLEFISDCIHILNTLLVSEKELTPLRQVLRNLKKEQDQNKKAENVIIFETLFESFCYNPMSTLALCLLSEEYKLAYNIIISFGDVEVHERILAEISQLVNMLESPQFVFLRLQLLEHEEHPFLVKCLYGLMMLLPQGQAFIKLKKRLKNISRAIYQKQDDENDFIDIQKLLAQFKTIRTLCFGHESKAID